MPAESPTTRLLEALQGLDLISADGRAGIGTLLSVIERVSPEALSRLAARTDPGRDGRASLQGIASPGIRC